MSTPVTIAVDGPAGSGKSSASKAVARSLDLDYVDTGAMYRAMTWWMLEHDVDIDDPDQMRARCGEPAVEIGCHPNRPSVKVDGTDVTAAIRESRVADAVSRVSAVPEVRTRLVRLQRELVDRARASGRGVIMEGRDITTVVLPDADLKLFLTADVEIRAQRRASENRARDGGDDAAHLDSAKANLIGRDAIDSQRAVSPLTKAGDAVEIDATHLDLDQVVERIESLARQIG